MFHIKTHMMKEKFILIFIFSFTIFFTENIFSQNWAFVGGVSAEAGANPSISVYGPNSMVVAGGTYIIGVSGTPFVARSTNGGASFTTLGINGIQLELYCVWAVNDDTIYAGDGGKAGGGGGNAHVYRTTNGGASWSVILSTGGNSGFINGIVFSRTNPLIGIAQSDPPAGSGNFWVQKTTNGGATWSLQQAPPGHTGLISNQNSVVITDANHYGFGTGQAGGSGVAYVIYTTNGGASWQNMQAANGPYLSAFAMSSDWVNGIAAAYNTLPVIGRTTNGCASFTDIVGDTSLSVTPVAKWVYGTQQVYVAAQHGGNGVIEQSGDGGLTWGIMSSSGTSGVSHLDLVYDSGTTLLHAYAICTDFGILQLITNVIGIDPNGTSIPKSYFLAQNYPNPFNPETSIKYSLPKYSYVTLKIYDMLGREVKTVVDSFQNTGSYVETIDISGFASGIYFYTLRAGDFVETKKMSLIK